MGIVYTGQIHYWQPYRQHDTSSILLLDTTVMTGNGLGVLLAPTWPMVKGVKSGEMSAAMYTEQYYGLLRGRYAANHRPFLTILGQEQVVLLCYCRDGLFCHRHLAVDILEKIAFAHDLPFQRGGEIRSSL